MAITTVTSDGLNDTAIEGKLGYVPPATGYANSTIFEFTTTAMHDGNLGTGESYPVSSQDAFGVPLQDVKIYDMMEPKSQIKTLDLGSGENYVGE
jgi:hypothetical protein